MTTSGKLLGIAEIAVAIGHGTRRQTVAQWHWRHKLPPATACLAAGPVWEEEAVREFIAQARAAAKKGAAKRRSC